MTNSIDPEQWHLVQMEEGEKYARRKVKKVQAVITDETVLLRNEVISSKDKATENANMYIFDNEEVSGKSNIAYNWNEEFNFIDAKAKFNGYLVVVNLLERENDVLPPLQVQEQDQDAIQSVPPLAKVLKSIIPIALQQITYRTETITTFSKQINLSYSED